MKGLNGIGLGLALAVMSAPICAQDIEWRPAAVALGKPGSAAPSVVPTSYSEPASASSSSVGIGLGKPISTPIDSSDTVPNTGRPLAFVRAQAPELPSQPLPVGAPIILDNGKPNTVMTASPPAPVRPMPLDSTFVSPMPRVVPETAFSSSCDCGTGHMVSGPGILDGCGVTCMADCGCGCVSDPCGCGEGCGYRGLRFYASAEYLGWAFSQKNLPPLVTVSPTGTPIAQSGVLGQPTTFTVFGQDNQESQFHSGGRFNLGVWFPRIEWGLEVDYFFLSQQSASATFGGNGDPQFSRPLILSTNGQEISQLVSFPGLVTGTVSVNTFSQLWGIEMNARQKLFCGPNWWVDMLYGYRHLDLSEGITIDESLAAVGGTQIMLHDQFNTGNVFNGPQIGVQGEWHFFPRWFLGGTIKLAMGDMRETVNINGSNLTLTPGMPVFFANNSGVLAQPTNVGSHSENRFAVIPEVNFKIGYDITEHWRVWVGYDFLFASSVVRPGDQIDRRVTPAQVLGPLNPTPPAGVTTPAVLFRTTNFYAQGVSAGVQFRW